MTAKRTVTVFVAVLAGVLLPGGWAHALINPNFTPKDLVKKSDKIMEVKFAPVKDHVATITVVRMIKGKMAAKTIPLSFANTAMKDKALSIEELINSAGNMTALLFIGKLSLEGDNGGEVEEKAFLHINRQWVVFPKEKGDVWGMDDISDKMLGTWDGDGEMLRKMIDYIQTDPDATVPCDEGVKWGDPKKFATLSGKAQTMPVTLLDGGRQMLFAAADSGDRLFDYDAKSSELKDVTAAHHLSSKSLVATWGDLNADGRMDLVSWNGEGVTVFMQDEKGLLQAGAKLPKSDIKGGCISLAVIDSGVAGHPAVLIGTAAMPLLWTPASGADAQVIKPVAAGEATVKELGAAGRCIAADFDADGIGDILQLFVNGSLIYKGKAPGQFEAPKPCAVALGTGASDAFTGDFDNDGLLDVVTTGDSLNMWNNSGKMDFKSVIMATGEMAHKNTADVFRGATGDINGDGRQDLIFFYTGEPPTDGTTPNYIPHINFNRGFRSFGHANAIDFISSPVITNVGVGQQSGCWTDLNGDGIQELVIALKNGELWFLPVDTGNEKGGCVRVMLSSKGAYAGPLNVVGYRGKRCLGAWNVLPGTAEGFVAQVEAGPVTIKWQFPGGKPQSKEIVIENAPKSLLIQ